MSKKSTNPKKTELPSASSSTTSTKDDTVSVASTESEYEVETIMGKEVIDGKVFYQIKWKG